MHHKIIYQFENKSIMGKIAWIYLILSGLFEIGFTTSLKLSKGFTNVLWGAAFILFAILSFGFLMKATKTIELGTAYAVWTGIGACGTIAVGLLFFHDSFSWLKMFFLVLIVTGIVGIKMISAKTDESKNTTETPTTQLNHNKNEN